MSEMATAQGAPFERRMAEAEAATQWTEGERWRNAILTAIGMHTGVWAASVLGRGRIPEVAQARQIACLLLRDDAKLRTSDVARLMERDHSTVTHAYTVTRMRMAGDAQFVRLVADIRTDATRVYLRRVVPQAPEPAPTPHPRRRTPAPAEPLPASGRMGDTLAWDTRGLSAREVAEAAYWRRRARERQRDMLGYAS